jgi:hypothetical protein
LAVLHPGLGRALLVLVVQVNDHQGSVDPVLSVDNEKKELVGHLATPANNGGPG